MIENFNFIHFLAATCLIEAFMLYLFRFTRSPFSGKAINQWYTNLGWSAIILDLLSFLIGFYLAKFLYLYLVNNSIISKDYEFIKFL